MDLEEIKFQWKDQKVPEKIIEKYVVPDFNEYQLHQIRMGFYFGLTEKQVDVYAKPEFNDFQMIQIREGYQSGLSDIEISMYARPECERYEMMRIKSELIAKHNK